MQALHTPLIGQDGTIPEESICISTKSRAGFNTNNETLRKIPTEGKADMEKVETGPGSPNLAIYTKSPMILNGRLEMFADSSEFILKWGGEEESLEREGDKGGRGIRRRSQRIADLCQKFEPNEYAQKVDLEVDVGGGVVGDQCFDVRKSTERGLKII